MHIHDLLNDCLSLIFRQLPLQEILRLRSVCLAWKCHIETELLPSVRRLKLFGDFVDVEHYCMFLMNSNLDDAAHLRLTRTSQIEEFYDDLIVPPQYLTGEFCQSLARLFPNLHELVIHFEATTPLEPILELLDQCGPRLTSLALSGSIHSEEFQIKLFSLIISLPKLTRLQILFCGFTQAINSLTHLLPRLTEFAINTFDGDILPILTQLKRCAALRLDWVDFTRDRLQESIEKNPDLPRNLTHFEIMHTEPVVVDFICRHFLNLRQFDLHLVATLNHDLLLSLSRLQHLTELRFTNVFFDLDLLPTQLASLPKLSTVRTLNLFNANAHWTSDVFYHTIVAIFPHIERITFKTLNNNPPLLGEIRQSIPLFRKQGIVMQIRRMWTSEDTARQMGRHEARFLAISPPCDHEGCERDWAAM